MEEVIKYFEQLEARIATLEAEVAELKNRPLPEPQVVEKVVEKVVETKDSGTSHHSHMKV